MFDFLKKKKEEPSMGFLKEQQNAGSYDYSNRPQIRATVKEKARNFGQKVSTTFGEMRGAYDTAYPASKRMKSNRGSSHTDPLFGMYDYGDKKRKGEAPANKAPRYIYRGGVRYRVAEPRPRYDREESSERRSSGDPLGYLNQDLFGSSRGPSERRRRGKGGDPLDYLNRELF
jgi:hypothetical protein